MLAEQGNMETPKDASTRISNLEKALETLTMAISRLNPSEDSVCASKPSVGYSWCHGFWQLVNHVMFQFLDNCNIPEFVLPWN